MPAWRLALCALVLFVPITAVGADHVRLHLIAHGAIEADVTAAHAIDHAHFCSAAADPWTAPDQPDPRAAPFPFYRLVFGQGGKAAELARPGPSLELALSNYFSAAQAHADPVNDSIEVVLDGRDFVGHADMRDPGYSFAVNYRADRRGGGFVAHHLRENGTGAGTLDLEGNWECPPVAADPPAREVAVHALFAGAVPAHPDPIPLRLSRSDIPCVDRGCAGWRVTDEQTGLVFLARVDLSRLHLARPLRRQAEQGQVELLVGARVGHGNPPRVIALELDGVQPAPAAPPEEPPPVPEAALR